MLPERPEFGSLPCPTCGCEVDALRAPRVLWLEDGPRFLCGERCRTRFLAGERPFDTQIATSMPAPSARRPSIPELVREATHSRAPAASGTPAREERRGAEALVAFGLALLAVGLIAPSASRELGWLGAFVVGLCAIVNARVPLTAVAASAPLRSMAPVGLVLATLAALFSSEPESERWALLGCAVAAVLVSSRNFVHAWATGGVRDVGAALESALPRWARIPSADASTYEEVPASGLRPGALTVVLEGERLPADGVVDEGQGLAELYPRAPRAVLVRPGDFLLAGTRVAEGALTVRAQRTDHERALASALGSRSDVALGSSRLARLQDLLERWGWVPFALLAVVAAASAGLGAAGALLLAVPALALVASIDAPLDAGARAAALRGMFFGNEAALTDAGRVQTTAILLRGALTAGEPVVQHVQPLGQTPVDQAIAIAAAAERGTPDHPIAKAILRYANDHSIVHSTLRKQRLHPGLGITAVGASGLVVVGRRQLLLNEGISVAIADDEAERIENEGLTAIFVAIDGNLEALLAVLDPTHVGAPDAVRRLAELPSEVVILSGDDRRTVEHVAQQLGASQVKAPLLPNERALEVRALRETGGVTAAIGRGGEDDAVLAAADVPVSMRLAGTATEQRGVVAAGRDVRDAAGALWIARAVRRSTLRGLALALVVLVAVVAGAWLGWLTPPVAAALALGTEFWALRAGSRLLRRVDLRVPMRQ